MINTKEDLHKYLHEDAKANFMANCSLVRYWCRLYVGSESAHVWRYLRCLRYCEYHTNNSGIFHRFLSFCLKIKLHRLGFKYNIRIPVNICGYGLTLYHLAGGGGCLVNAKKVGNYCQLQPGVLIGNSHQSENEKPIIGDNVSFGPGAKVLGSVSIGNNSFVAANAVVVKDMPANSLIGGVPANVIKLLVSKV